MKTIVFSFDGTGNEPNDVGKVVSDESISNVLKLHILLGGRLDDVAPKPLNGSEQLSFYYSGVGTRDEWGSVPVFRLAKRAVNMVAAPEWGDARRIENDAMTTFQREYKSGSRVAVFGFSRGAAIARRFVSNVLTRHPKAEVDFLGVFDTVAAMNGVRRRGQEIATDVLFENGTLHERVKRAVHLVSLDDARVAFHPTLINRHRGSGRILEVWMPGGHSDVGGGFWMDGLSDSALEFMIEELERALGKDISVENGKDGDAVRTVLAASAEVGDSLADVTADDIVIRPLVDGPMHTADKGSLTARVMAAGWEARTVCVNENDRPCPDDEDDEETLPLVHESVLNRYLQVKDYRPAALRGVRFRLLHKDGATEPLKGITGLFSKLR